MLVILLHSFHVTLSLNPSYTLFIAFSPVTCIINSHFFHLKVFSATKQFVPFAFTAILYLTPAALKVAHFIAFDLLCVLVLVAYVMYGRTMLSLNTLFTSINL